MKYKLKCVNIEINMTLIIMEGMHMESRTAYNEHGMEDITSQGLVGGTEAAVKSTVDISREVSTILRMTPIDGYQKKLDLIYRAADMSTMEKIRAIDHAEDKYAQDLQRTEEMCEKIVWAKVGVALVVVVGGLYLCGSQDGRKLVSNLWKSRSTIGKECA